MTLNQYIETLTSLRDHYNAGDFTVRLRKIVANTNTDDCLAMVEEWDWADMDGDDFWLNLEENTANIDCKTVQKN